MSNLNLSWVKLMLGWVLIRKHISAVLNKIVWDTKYFLEPCLLHLSSFWHFAVKLGGHLILTMEIYLRKKLYNHCLPQPGVFAGVAAGTVE